MDEHAIVEKVNDLLSQSGCLMEVTDLMEIGEFLNDESNTELEVYEEIENLYSQLMEDNEFES